MIRFEYNIVCFSHLKQKKRNEPAENGHEPLQSSASITKVKMGNLSIVSFATCLRNSGVREIF